jgi:hypothetical protein
MDLLRLATIYLDKRIGMAVAGEKPSEETTRKDLAFPANSFDDVMQQYAEDVWKQDRRIGIEAFNLSVMLHVAGRLVAGVVIYFLIRGFLT